MWWRAFVVFVAWSALLRAFDARAVDVVLGWEGTTRWNSNVLSSSRNEESDFAIRTGPLMELRQRRGEVTGQLRWRSLWEGFLDTDGANNFEHFVNLDGAWQVDSRNQLRITNDFARTNSITAQLLVQDGALVSPGQGVDVGTDSTLFNLANATFVHRLSPLVSFEASVNNSVFNFENEGSSDGISTRGALQVTRVLSPLMTVGVGAAFTRQDFDDTTFQPGTGAGIIEVFGIWNYQITPTLVMSTTLGPALNRPDSIQSSRLVPQVPTRGSFLVDAAGCPNSAFSNECPLAIAQDLATGATGALPIATQSVPLVEASFLTGAPQSDDTMTVFGAWSLVKRWEKTSAQLRVQRRTSAASSNGVSTDLTFASVSFTWEPVRRWQFSGTAGWTLQTSASDFPITEIVVEPATIFVDASGQVVAENSPLAAFRADGAAVSSGVREAGSTDSAFETTTYQIQFLAKRQISRRLTALSRVSFFRSERSGDLQADTTTDSARIEIGLVWQFDPMRF